MNYYPAFLDLRGRSCLVLGRGRIADKRAARNIHEIRVVSKAGDISTRTENLLHPDNPKTSYLAVLSAIAALRQILVPVRVGT